MTAAIMWALVLVAGLCVGMALIVWPRRDTPSAPQALMIAGATFVWTLGYFLEIRATSESMMLLAARVQYTVIPIVPVIALWFAALHSRPTPAPSVRVVVAAVIVPVITMAMAWTNELHGLVWSEVSVLDGDGWSVLVVDYGAYFWVHVAYSYACLIAALAMVISIAFTTSGVLLKQSLIVILGMAISWVANFLRIVGISPIDPFDPTPFAFALTTVAFGIAVSNLRLFSLAPIARDLVIEALDDGILVLDGSGRVVELNGAATRILQVPAKFAVGRFGREVLGPFAAVLDAEDASRPLRVSPSTGTGSFDCTRLPMVETERDDRPVVVLLRDVSALAKATAQIEDMRAHLERELRNTQRVEGIGTWMGGIAHDLNNLLTAVLGFSELAISGIDDGEDIREDLDQIATAGNHAKNLVAQILKMGRASKGAPGAICLRDSVRDAVALLRAVIPPEIEIETNIASHIPQVFADGTQIQQVLMNLCVNAAHAMPDGGHLTLTLNASSDGWPGSMGCPTELVGGGRVHLTVSDTGMGMDADTASKIFDPFFSTKAEGQGTGLGLSVVKNIIDEHGGEIEVRSEPARGTVFTIRLPTYEAAGAVTA